MNIALSSPSIHHLTWLYQTCSDSINIRAIPFSAYPHCNDNNNHQLILNLVDNTIPLRNGSHAQKARKLITQRFPLTLWIILQLLNSLEKFLADSLICDIFKLFER